MASVHDKLGRIRKPRVHISYEVETEGATVERELPFVMGVLGDFAGDPTEPLKPVAERKFVQIDRDNFNDVMARIAPGLNIKVDNTLADDGSQMAVNLKFRSMEDFDPQNVVQQVPALKARWLSSGDSEAFRTGLIALTSRAWRLVFERHQPLHFVAWP